MRRIPQEVPLLRLPCPIFGLTSVCRRQSSRSQTSDSIASFRSHPDDGEVTSLFPGERAKYEAGEQPRPRRRRGNCEADTLLQDIIALGKIVSDEQKRGRVSIPASRLAASSGLNTHTTKRAALGDAASSLPSAEGSRDAKPVVAPPLLSSSAVAASAGIRSRPSSFPLMTSRAPEAAPPPLQSCTSAFMLTSDQLQAISDAHGASDIAFTLEELENTLFSVSIENTEGDSEVTKAHAPTELPAPAPPPVAPTMPCSDVPPAPLEPIPAALPIDTVGAAASPVTQTAASPRPALDTSTPASATASTEPCRPSAADSVTASLPIFSPCACSEHCGLPEKPSTRKLLATPVLRCCLRGSVVYVRMIRPSPTLRELLEALHEAVSFIESLPALPGGPRLVRLGVDSTSAVPASCAFLEPTGWNEVTCSVEERLATLLLKERLLRRITEGPVHGLQYIAELCAADVESPLIIRDTAAELLLACTTHEIRPRARPDVVLNGSTMGAVRLSFSGISVGVFPAPSTVLRVLQTVAVVCDREVERTVLLEGLARAGGRPADTATAPKPCNLVAEVMQCLHHLPLAVSTELLRGSGSLHGCAREQAAGAAGKDLDRNVHWLNTARVMCRQWWQWVRERGHKIRSTYDRDLATYSSRMSSCLTASEVWKCLCDVILSPEIDDVYMPQALYDAMHSKPVRRCRQNYLTVASSAFAHTADSDHPLPAVVVEVTSSSLQRTSVADLACEIREQPADVVLVLSTDIRLTQKLQFLASLHLTDIGSHHRVTVLLPGDPAEVAECVSLTRSCARLTGQLCYSEANLSIVHPCHPRWLHQIIEVSNARSSDAGADSPEAPHDSVPAELAELYATHVWRRPCITTRTSSVGLEISAAVAFAWQRWIAAATGAAKRKAAVQEFEHTHLAPLVLLRPPAREDGGVDAVRPWWTEYGEMSMTQMETAMPTTFRTLVKSMSAAWPVSSSVFGRGVPTNGSNICAAELGVAFLFVLDVACQSLLRRAVESPDQLNVLSIAALGLDPSAGGLLDVADRVAGDGVETILSAMEEVTTVHGLRFASLALLRWMVDHRLLFYQLTPHTIDRYIAYSPNRGV
ncbi:hypothetical protein, conserved [Leishmania tarentolae]|uniref:Uncharacterized protein n=1 Tax=Leishmania tarentolae TaxID=5689 RepID=A0A640L1N3_LEITA|nr:hypothetical protein, conserved [Leishmania tarentolae]